MKQVIAEIRGCRRLILLQAAVAIIPVTASAQTTVWGLQRGDQFSVETTVEQETILQFEGGQPTTSRTKERCKVGYMVFAAMPDETVIRASIVDIKNDAESENVDVDDDWTLDRQSRQLKRLPMTFFVNPSGTVRQTQGVEAAMRQLAGVNKRSQTLMQAAVSGEAVATWIHQPFWLAPSKLPISAEQTWQRVSHSSLGLLGSVQTTLTFNVSKADENTADISISGDARHVPNTRAEASGITRLSFEDVIVEAKEFTGSARLMFQPATEQELPEEQNTSIRPGRPSDRRPWFDRMTLEWRISGTATVKSGAKLLPLKFGHRQKQTSRLLPGYITGAPRRFTPFLPRPRQP